MNFVIIISVYSQHNKQIIMIKLDEELAIKLEQAVKNFQGNATTLESAIGAIFIGQCFGWRMLKMIHNPST